MSYPNVLFGPEGEQFNTYSTKRWPLGTKLILQDGREFRFFKAGASNIATGVLIQSEVPEANWDTLAIPAIVAIGSRAFDVTNGATTITKDELAGGYLVVESGTGAGHIHQIEGNDAEAAGSADFEVRLAPGSGIQVALDTTSKVTLLKSPYIDAIIHPSPPTAKVIGVTQVAVAAANYGWVATKGVTAVLIDGTVVIGQDVMASNGTDGSVEAYAFTEGTPNTLITPAIGHVVEVAPTTSYGAIALDIKD